jgi:hypothetical protein
MVNKQTWLISRYYHDICLQGLEKFIKIPQPRYQTRKIKTKLGSSKQKLHMFVLTLIYYISMVCVAEFVSFN